MTSDSSKTVLRASGRKGNKKVRTGCLTCKVRKVKCDEAKPACLRCVRTNRKCDGYKATRRMTQLTSLTRLCPTMEFESLEGCRVFDYYRSQSAPILGSIMDSEFWGGLVMRLSVSEPIVRHAVLALSSLHQHYSTVGTDKAAVGPSFAFAEYGKAIDALRKWTDGPVVPLLACILFVCIEFLLDDEDATKLHIVQGRQLLSSLEHEASHTRDMVKQELVPMYTRLGLPTFLFGVQPPGVPKFLKPPRSTFGQYENLSQARSYLYDILDAALRFSTSTKPKLYDAGTSHLDIEHLQAEQQRILSYLSEWYAAFAVFTSSSNMSSTSGSVQSLLRMYYNAAFIWISTALSTSELSYDAHMSSFASIVSEAGTIVNAFSRGSNLYSFSFETELVAPLYWTIIKCRQPLLRRAALRLLMHDQLKGRRENLWHSQEAIVVASRAIEIEEWQGTKLYDGAFNTESCYSQCAGDFTPELQSSADLFIPTSQPPTVTGEQRMDASDSTCVSSTGQTPSRLPCPVVQPAAVDVLHRADTENLKMVSPYGVDESSRIKNILIGPRETLGVWITVFKDPKDGKDQWDVTREMLAFSG